MVKVTPSFQEAVVADSRRTVTKAVVEIISPDVVYGAVKAANTAPTSIPDQIKNRVMSLSYPYATLELNRWVLDGSLHILNQNAIHGEQGWTSNVISNADGLFASDPWVELQFTGVSILQACSVIFGAGPLDGVPADFTAAVMVGNTEAWSQRVTGNIQSSRNFTGFTVNNPTGLRITFHRTSIPFRRPRVAELIAGICEEWTNNDIVSISIKQQGDPSCASLPYGTMTLMMDNSTRRFDPGSKAGMFQSLEDRQGIKAYIGVRFPDGTDEFAPVGVYYQFQGGWKTGANNLSMTWNMVDIIGLVSGRSFVVPAVLPTTLLGWIKAIVGQLGVNFVERCTVDSAVAAKSVIANRVEDVTGLKCGDVLRFACMAAGAWARAANDTGNLLVEAVGGEGTKILLDNLSDYPSIQANNDVAAINFTVYDGSDRGTAYTVAGNQPSSSLTLNISNPFLHTLAQCDSSAALILSAYGGNKITTSGRGDAASEIGDLDTVEINKTQSVQGRRIYQTLNVQNGILSGCQGAFLVSDMAMTSEKGDRAP